MIAMQDDPRNGKERMGVSECGSVIGSTSDQRVALQEKEGLLLAPNKGLALNLSDYRQRMAERLPQIL